MPEAQFKKVLGVLQPADPLAEELMNKIPHNAYVTVKVTRNRSLKHNNLYFAILKKVYENSDAEERFKSIEQFRALVAIGAGHFEWASMPNSDGDRFPIAKSIAFDKMDQTEFREFFAKAIDVIDNKLHLIASEDLRREFEDMLGGSAA